MHTCHVIFLTLGQFMEKMKAHEDLVVATRSWPRVQGISLNIVEVTFESELSSM